VNSQPLISDFSAHLFWDVKRDEIQFETNKAFIVQRVLELGVMKDWLLLNKLLSLKEITEVAKNLRSLDDISLNFISKRSNLPKEKFRCYTNKRLLPKHWPF